MKKYIILVGILLTPFIASADTQTEYYQSIGNFIKIMEEKKVKPVISVVTEESKPSLKGVETASSTPEAVASSTPNSVASSTIEVLEPVYSNGLAEVKIMINKPYVEAVSKLSKKDGAFRGLIWSGIEDVGRYATPRSNYERFEGLTAGEYDYEVKIYSAKRVASNANTDDFGYSASNLISSVSGTFIIQ